MEMSGTVYTQHACPWAVTQKLSVDISQSAALPSQASAVLLCDDFIV